VDSTELATATEQPCLSFHAHRDACSLPVFYAVFPAYALVWLFLKLVGFMKDVRHLSVRVVPLVATLALLIVPLCFMRLGGAQFGSFNLWTAGIFLGTFFFPILSVVGFVLCSVFPKEEIHRAVKIHSLLVSSAAACSQAFSYRGICSRYDCGRLEAAIRTNGQQYS